jgi:hypothetical protein
VILCIYVSFEVEVGKLVLLSIFDMSKKRSTLFR